MLNQIRQSVDRLLAHLIEQQEKTVARWHAGETQQVIMHLFPMKAPNPPMALKIYYAEKRSKEGQQRRPHCIAILLNMDRLGMIRADLALIAQQQLHIRFFVSSEAVQERFKQHLINIREALILSFKQLQMDVILSPDKITDFYHEDATGAAAGRIDLTI